MRSSLVAYQTPIPELQPKKKWLRDYHKVDKNKKKWRFGMCCTISDDDLSEDDIQNLCKTLSLNYKLEKRHKEWKEITRHHINALTQDDQDLENVVFISKSRKNFYDQVKYMKQRQSLGNYDNHYCQEILKYIQSRIEDHEITIYFPEQNDQLLCMLLKTESNMIFVINKNETLRQRIQKRKAKGNVNIIEADGLNIKFNHHCLLINLNNIFKQEAIQDLIKKSLKMSSNLMILLPKYINENTIVRYIGEQIKSIYNVDEVIEIQNIYLNGNFHMYIIYTNLCTNIKQQDKVSFIKDMLIQDQHNRNIEFQYSELIQDLVGQIGLKKLWTIARIAQSNETDTALQRFNQIYLIVDRFFILIKQGFLIDDMESFRTPHILQSLRSLTLGCKSNREPSIVSKYSHQPEDGGTKNKNEKTSFSFNQF